MSRDKVVVIGAGVGGLAAALELVSAGADVTVLERHSGPGGKMRTLPSGAGPVDAGPTVFTMRPVFEELFDAAGTSLEAELTLSPCDVLARHHWRGAPVLDLMADQAASVANVEAFAGAAEAQRFKAFTDRANLLFNAFEGPVMRSAAPSLLSVTRAVMADALTLTKAMAPLSTLWQALGRAFEDHRLRQLFGRYATYVGGSPLLSPALLMLIWASEQRGVWHLKGGMHSLAQALARLIEAKGGQISYDTPVARIEMHGDRAEAVITGDGTRIAADAILFNGDPSALASGLVEGVPDAAPRTHLTARSLSAWVWTWAAPTSGFELAQHTVFFSDDSPAEFRELFTDYRRPSDPTLYICAQDRGDAHATGPERMQMIMNAPADGDVHSPSKEEISQCTSTVFARLAEAGLITDPPTARAALTTPDQFSTLFPGTGGALYGANPHGAMRTFQRPTARSKVKGLYLCGGGCHPGPGVPMAALSGRHAAAAIISDRALTYRSATTATPGGISTGSLTTAPKVSRSSAS
ncbi:MAG: 1-hydroxycarotenoid 3,4-desaturase CrtD [Pseudomonadota bacterium]